MKKVILQFPSLDELLEYAEVINIEKCYTNKRKLIIKGELSDADISLAVNSHGATLLHDIEGDQ